MAARTASSAGPRDVRATSLDTSHNGLAQGADVPQASANNFFLHLPDDENTSSLYAPSRCEDSRSGKNVLGHWVAQQSAGVVGSEYRSLLETPST